MPAAATQPRLDRRAMPDNARGQIMALVARDAVEDVFPPESEAVTKARILEYYRYNAFGSVTVLPVYDRNDSSYSHVESAGAYSHTADDIPGSGSRSDWDMIENTPLDLSDNNALMHNRRTGSGGHAMAGEGYGRAGAWGNEMVAEHLAAATDCGLLFSPALCLTMAATVTPSLEARSPSITGKARYQGQAAPAAPAAAADCMPACKKAAEGKMPKGGPAITFTGGSEQENTSAADRSKTKEQIQEALKKTHGEEDKSEWEGKLGMEESALSITYKSAYHFTPPDCCCYWVSSIDVAWTSTIYIAKDVDEKSSEYEKVNWHENYHRSDARAIFNGKAFQDAAKKAIADGIKEMAQPICVKGVTEEACKKLASTGVAEQSGWKSLSDKIQDKYASAYEEKYEEFHKNEEKLWKAHQDAKAKK